MIDVMSGNADECGDELAGEDAEKLKATKMGSTDIRRWIVESQRGASPQSQGEITTARGSLTAFASRR